MPMMCQNEGPRSTLESRALERLHNLGGRPKHVPNNGVLAAAAAVSDSSLGDANFHLPVLNTRLLQPVTRSVV